MKHEKPTDELRQVRRPVYEMNGVMGPGHQQWATCYETTVQRKWLVQDGDVYKDVWPRQPGDIQVDTGSVTGTTSEGTTITIANVCDCRLTYAPTKEEWRDLETVWIGGEPKARAQ